MIRTAAVAGLVLFVSMDTVALAQTAAPQAYTLKTEGPFLDRKMTLTVERDGARERVEMAIGEMVMTSLFDFEAHRVYWIGWSGPGTCTSGRYLSSRAPVDQDPVTGTAERGKDTAKARSHHHRPLGPTTPWWPRDWPSRPRRC
jgi:hypothetical protein